MVSTANITDARVLGTKAETLHRLAPRVKSAKILPLYYFTVAEWKADRKKILKEVTVLEWAKGELIVRSSAIAEDRKNQSMAGAYDSIACKGGEKELESSIEKVIESYGSALPRDQVLIQPLLQNVKMSGVAFTADPSSAAPYIIINYDDKSGDTTTVTSGATNELKTYIHCRYETEKAPDELKSVLHLAGELAQLTHDNALDIEFAVTSSGELYLLQARHLVMPGMLEIKSDEHRELIRQAEQKLKQIMQPHPFMHGKRTVLGVMPDWNPAEIIGVRPRPLALSLYRELVTDSIWAYQRDNYGYKQLRSVPLMLNLHGLPYIDVRASFNSFIPKSVRPELAEKLVNYYIDRLIEFPVFHDKVEFMIVYSCYTFDLEKRLADLKGYGFSDGDLAEFTDSLRGLTNRIINAETGLWKGDLAKIEKLERRHKEIMESSLDDVSKVYWLLEDCKRYGTLPFAGLARAGFIAVQLLKSLTSVGAITDVEEKDFMASLNTISNRMAKDFGSLTRYQFLAEYGHLRPGTYDILSPRYDEDPSRYFDWDNAAPDHKHGRETFSLSLKQMQEITLLLEKHQVQHDMVGLFEFLKSGIEGREYSKFIFSRNLSDALSLLKRIGEKHDLSPEDMSFLHIGTIHELYNSCTNAATLIKDSIRQGKARYQQMRQINLPPLITKPEDVWGFYMPPNEPNYITHGAVTAKVKMHTNRDELEGAIVLIENADPGFDWLFSHRIAGFITAFGGLNSHMAIRASELGIPAVIGIGEHKFKSLRGVSVINIDCANRQLKVIK